MSLNTATAIRIPACPARGGAAVDALRGLLSVSVERNALLLVACHGTFDPSEPMRSGLELSDGRLDAALIAYTSTNYDEAVLWACSIGDRVRRVGDVELVGDDILGLPGAFLEAGVGAVLVSIPRLVVNPSTSLFFHHYLNARRSAAPPTLALNTAQRDAWNAGDDPSAWCAITLYGVG